MPHTTNGPEISLPPNVDGPIQGSFNITLKSFNWTQSLLQSAQLPVIPKNEQLPYFLLIWWGQVNTANVNYGHWIGWPAPDKKPVNKKAKEKSTPKKSVKPKIPEKSKKPKKDKSLWSSTKTAAIFPIKCKPSAFKTYLKDMGTFIVRMFEPECQIQGSVNIYDLLTRLKANESVSESFPVMYQGTTKEKPNSGIPLIVGHVEFEITMQFNNISVPVIDKVEDVEGPYDPVYPAKMPSLVQENKSSLLMSPMPSEHNTSWSPPKKRDNDIEEHFLPTKKEIISTLYDQAKDLKKAIDNALLNEGSKPLYGKNELVDDIYGETKELNDKFHEIYDNEEDRHQVNGGNEYAQLNVVHEHEHDHAPSMCSNDVVEELQVAEILNQERLYEPYESGSISLEDTDGDISDDERRRRVISRVWSKVTKRVPTFGDHGESSRNEEIQKEKEIGNEIREAIQKNKEIRNETQKEPQKETEIQRELSSKQKIIKQKQKSVESISVSPISFTWRDSAEIPNAVQDCLKQSQIFIYDPVCLEFSVPVFESQELVSSGLAQANPIDSISSHQLTFDLTRDFVVNCTSAEQVEAWLEHSIVFRIFHLTKKGTGRLIGAATVPLKQGKVTVPVYWMKEYQQVGDKLRVSRIKSSMAAVGDLTVGLVFKNLMNTNDSVVKTTKLNTKPITVPHDTRAHFYWSVQSIEFDSDFPSSLHVVSRFACPPFKTLLESPSIQVYKEQTIINFSHFQAIDLPLPSTPWIVFEVWSKTTGKPSDLVGVAKRNCTDLMTVPPDFVNSTSPLVNIQTRLDVINPKNGGSGCRIMVCFTFGTLHQIQQMKRIARRFSHDERRIGFVESSNDSPVDFLLKDVDERKRKESKESSKGKEEERNEIKEEEEEEMNDKKTQNVMANNNTQATQTLLDMKEEQIQATFSLKNESQNTSTTKLFDKQTSVINLVNDSSMQTKSLSFIEGKNVISNRNSKTSLYSNSNFNSTSNINSISTNSSIQINLTVERGMHLPRILSPSHEQGLVETFPNPFCSFEWTDDKTYTTNIVKNTDNPQWNNTFTLTNISLPTLRSTVLVLKVWHKEEESRMLGFCKVDLSPLFILDEIHGWYHVTGFRGQDNGQILVRIVPLQLIGSAKELSVVTVQDEPIVDSFTLKAKLSQNIDSLDKINRRLSDQLKSRKGNYYNEETDSEYIGHVNGYKNEHVYETENITEYETRNLNEHQTENINVHLNEYGTVHINEHHIESINANLNEYEIENFNQPEHESILTPEKQQRLEQILEMVSNSSKEFTNEISYSNLLGQSPVKEAFLETKNLFSDTGNDEQFDPDTFVDTVDCKIYEEPKVDHELSNFVNKLFDAFDDGNANGGGSSNGNDDMGSEAVKENGLEERIGKKVCFLLDNCESFDRSRLESESEKSQLESDENGQTEKTQLESDYENQQFEKSQLEIDYENIQLENDHENNQFEKVQMESDSENNEFESESKELKKMELDTNDLQSFDKEIDQENIVDSHEETSDHPEKSDFDISDISTDDESENNWNYKQQSLSVEYEKMKQRVNSLLSSSVLRPGIGKEISVKYDKMAFDQKVDRPPKLPLSMNQGETIKLLRLMNNI